MSGSLTRFGWSAGKASRERHRALNKAIRAGIGIGTLIKKLVYLGNVNQLKEVKTATREDVGWLRRKM